MTVESVNLGKRNPPAPYQPSQAVSMGMAMTGDVTVLDFGREVLDIPLHWDRVSTTNMEALKTALFLKPWQAVTIACDSGDDLGFGASGTVSTLIYVANSFRAEKVPNFGDYWRVDFTVRKIS